MIWSDLGVIWSDRSDLGVMWSDRSDLVNTGSGSDTGVMRSDVRSDAE